MEPLSSDIVQEILSRVPAESVLECKLVCKKWVTLIRESNFANMHLSHLLNHLHGGDDDDNDNLAAKVDTCFFFACSIDHLDVFKTLLFHGGQLSDRISPDEKYIYNQNMKRIYHPPMHHQLLLNHLVGSCNGLVCAFQLHDNVLDPIYICNPLTREYVYLPRLVPPKKEFYRFEEIDVVNMYDTACGFGYVRSTNEYKVVRIHYQCYWEGNVEVYTLGSGCGWRALGRVPHRLCTLSGGRGTYANDVIYWISLEKVVAFDLADEKFQVLSVPPCLQNRRNGDRYGLVALGRHLCLYVQKLRVEIWVLRRRSDLKERWRLEFDIDYEAVVGSRDMNFQPILLAKNGEIIFLYDESVLYSYDPKTTLLKIISNEATTDYFEDVDAIAHINTFTSLGAMGENSKRYTVRSPLDDVIDDLERITLGEEIDTTRYKLR